MTGRGAAVAFLLALGLLTPAMARGQRPTAVDQAIEAVMGQLDAFRRDDFATAYGFASETIHGLFAREAFEAMVRGGYPEIAHSIRAVIDTATAGPAGSVLLSIRVHGANGNAVDALYELVAESGGWKVNSVVTRPAGSSI